MPQDTTHFLTILPSQSLTVINESADIAVPSLGDQIARACQAWLAKSPSRDTRSNYERDIKQFLEFARINGDQPEKLAGVRPEHVSGWRDHLQAKGLTNSSVRRKMTAVRSLLKCAS
jgi:site-specific recombinase XerD